MAAYAALVSLMNNMDQIQIHPRLSISFHKKQIESLGEKVRFLLEFIESYNSHGGSKEAEDLESQIASAANVAEDVIESHAVDQMLAVSTEKRTSSLLDLEKVIQDMNSIKEKVMEVKEKWGFKEDQLTRSMPATWSRPHVTTRKHTMVGFDDELIQLMDVLTGQQPSRKIFSIIGMGGMGKTTLARNAYENLVITQHFDVRAWATVSQEYSVREILSQLLSHKEKSIDETIDKLGEQLYKNLCGRRYLIILDDMWSTEVWDKMKLFFPDNGNRSRVVITTRLSVVGVHCGSSCFRMKFLNEDISWILFCETVFGHGELCPPELGKIGREIVRQCRGLPLSITVIGGLLQKSYKTTGYWENVAENLSSILNFGAEDCLNILSLSYIHLPAHLKPCFLYMGTFREDSEINISQMIKLWVAEGFIKPNGAQILEKIGEGYLEDLVDRNLILVDRRRQNGKIKSCRVHDLLRDLCLKIGEKENFFRVLSVLGTPERTDRERRLVFHDIISKHHNSRVFHALQSASLARSLVCRVQVELPFILRLLRVLTTVENCSPESMFQNYNLRYLSAWSWKVSIPWLPSVSLIWNLQTLVIKHFQRIDVPREIWKMPQLRHIQCDEFRLPDPLLSDDEQDDFFVMGNLQTLSKPVNFAWSEEVSKRIPNIRRLHLYYAYIMDGYDERLRYHLHNLGRLQKLESLNIEFPKIHNARSLDSGQWVYLPKENLTFPDSLNKLSLTNSSLYWKDLTILICSLPHLEVLKLNSVLGRDWSLAEEQFLRLKFLKVESCLMISWNADICHFPVLEKIVLRNLDHLDEIPSGIGEIPTLELIHVDHCSKATEVSAMKIKDERENLGYDDIEIQVTSGGQSLKSFSEMIQKDAQVILGNDDLQVQVAGESYSERVETFYDNDRDDEKFRLV